MRSRSRRVAWGALVKRSRQHLSPRGNWAAWGLPGKLSGLRKGIEVESVCPEDCGGLMAEREGR